MTEEGSWDAGNRSEETGLTRSLNAIMEGQKSQFLVTLFLISQSTPYVENQAPGSTKSNPELKWALIREYRLEVRRDAEGRVFLRCQATGEVILMGACVGGHLFPRRAGVRNGLECRVYPLVNALIGLRVESFVFGRDVLIIFGQKWPGFYLVPEVCKPWNMADYAGLHFCRHVGDTVIFFFPRG